MLSVLKISGLTITLAFVLSCKKSDPTMPTLTTKEVFIIEQSIATSGGNISSDGGASITARGVCWSTLPEPTTALPTKTLDGRGSGDFHSTLTGLIPNTIYYVRAYASNSVGTVYGSQVSFVTPFKTVTIGSQTWMAENLQTSEYNDGTKIQLVTDKTAWGNLVTPGFCWYNNDSTTYKKLYGALYNVSVRRSTYCQSKILRLFCRIDEIPTGITVVL